MPRFDVKPLFKSLQKIYFLLNKKERKLAGRLFILLLLAMILETFSIGLVIPGIALLTQQDLIHKYPQVTKNLAWVGNPTQGEIVAAGAIFIIGVYFIKNLYLGWVTWFQACFSFQFQSDLSCRLFSMYLYQPYTFHLQKNSAQLIRNIYGEVEVVTVNCISPLIQLIAELLVLIGIATLLFTFEPLGAMAVLTISTGAAIIFYYTIQKATTRWGYDRQIHATKCLLHLKQALGGVKDVKIVGREKNFIDQYKYHNREATRISKFQAVAQQVPRLWLEVLAVSGLAILVLVMLAQGHSMNAIVAILGLFGAAAFRILPSVNRILLAAQSLRYGFPAVETVTEELLLRTDESDPILISDKIKYEKEIEVQDVSFTYPGTNNKTLDKISLNILKQSSVGIIGESGSGKSTLIDIIIGLHRPSEGRVLIDGQDILKNLRGWQNRIGYVSQNIFLTDDTLARNIAFGVPEDQISQDLVAEAVRLAQLDDLVNSLPHGINTYVGEHGVRLSGGQRQRIGIARALYYNPDVIVLDEATSSLDEQTQNEVMMAINNLKKFKTLIVVAHRFSTIRNCDVIYCLENGKVKSWGGVEEMLVLQ